MTINDHPCYFCGNAAKVATDRDVKPQWVVFLDCKVCGIHHLTYNCWTTRFESKSLTPVARINCIAENIAASETSRLIWMEKEDEKPETYNNCVVKYIDDVSKYPIHHSSKPDQILVALAKKCRDKLPFASVALSEREAFALKIADQSEFEIWMGVLLKAELVLRSQRQGPANAGIAALHYQLTPRGWSKVEELNRGVHSNQAFIAMSFSPDTRGPIEAAIKKACYETGWDPVIVSEQEYLGDVTDQILALVKQSAFVIAEFTENKRGVYYEAGYGEGLGRPVILAVHKDYENGAGENQKLHFDTRNFNHIIWETHEELTRKLVARIQRVINRAD